MHKKIFSLNLLSLNKCYMFTWPIICYFFPCSRHNSLPQWLPRRFEWNLCVGEVDEGVKRLVQTTYECLMQAIDSGEYESTFKQHYQFNSMLCELDIWPRWYSTVSWWGLGLGTAVVQYVCLMWCTLMTFRGQTYTEVYLCWDLKKLVSVLCLVKPGIRYRELGNIIQKHAQASGFSVVRSYCGHGIHKLFHTAPNVPHYASE